jgi:hypothetical protein
MSISKINGVLWENISKILNSERANTKNVISIKASVSVKCTEVMLAYGRDGSSACGGNPITYYLDESTATVSSIGTLYSICGTKLTQGGYYSDGRKYWEWNGTSLSLIGECRR